MATAEETEPTLLSTEPLPPEKVPVRVVLEPAVMVAAAGTKLAMAGAATTVTVVEAVFVPSAWEVAVMVTLWAEAGAVKAPVEALIVPAVADQVMPVFDAPETELVKVVAPFTVMVGAAGLTAAMLTLWGVTVTEVVAVVPAALVTVRV